MKKEFIVERQGKAFVLYAGLLDLAHQNGLRAIRTELVQIPNEENYRTAIVTATAVFIDRDGKERHFTGLGDAAPNNVAPMMLTCLLRMAETRAKARALRDAVNVGVTAFEELGEEEATGAAPERDRAGHHSQAAPDLRIEGAPRAGKCTLCNAPADKPHASGCTRAAATARA